MKILFIKSCCHIKNFNFILKCRKIDFTIVNNVSETYNLNFADYDAVYSPCEPIDVSKYPDSKFIFGPQFSVFPDEKLNFIKSKNSVYNLLSNWVISIWSSNKLCNDLKLIKLPFGVDTDKFNEINLPSDRIKVFVYFKRRNPEELQLILDFFQNKNIEIKLFNYVSRYSEEEYLNYLQNSKYGVWLDAHESQGFALQEALSCNVPLLVWNASSMNQECGSSYTNFPASTIPYWDERCGEFFYKKEEFEDKFNIFSSRLETYKPREYVLENLSIDVCENKLINFIQNM
jgi:arsenate reductase-like glutaredoxin family protein